VNAERRAKDTDRLVDIEIERGRERERKKDISI
jgi:hypothetical protein